MPSQPGFLPRHEKVTERKPAKIKFFLESSKEYLFG